MKQSQTIKELRKQAKIWRNRILAKEPPAKPFPHPGQVILQLLEQLYHYSGISKDKNLSRRCNELHTEVTGNIPKFPSLELGDNFKLDTIEHLLSFCNLVKKPGPTKDELNLKARELLKKQPTISIRRLSAKLGCPKSTVARLSSWRAVQEQLKKGRKPRPKTIRSGELDQLIADQLEDDSHDRIYPKL